MELLAELPPNVTKPVILAGGAGKASHLVKGLEQERVDAVATAHLFNFVGDAPAVAELCGTKASFSKAICYSLAFALPAIVTNLPVIESTDKYFLLSRF